MIKGKAKATYRRNRIRWMLRGRQAAVAF